MESDCDMSNIKINDITLAIINRCNFKCDYCYCKEPSVKELSFNRYNDLLNLLKILPLDDTVNIILSGGEVTMFEDKIYEAYDNIRKFNRYITNKLRLGVYTNGTNLEVLVNAIGDGIFDTDMCAVSWDGLTSSNVRRPKTEKFTDDYMKAQLKILGDSGYGDKVLVRTALSSASIDTLYDSVKFLLDINCNTWEYYLLNDNEEYADESFVNKFAYQLQLIINEYKINKNFKFYNLENFMKLYNDIKDDSCNKAKGICCGKVGSTLNIGVTGLLSPCGSCCPEHKHFNSKMFSTDMLNVPEFIKLYKKYIEYCSSVKFCDYKNCINFQCIECAFEIQFRQSKNKSAQPCKLRTEERLTYLSTISKELVLNRLKGGNI